MLGFDRVADRLADPDSLMPGGEEGEYFRLRRLLETKQYSLLDKAKFALAQGDRAGRSFFIYGEKGAGKTLLDG